MPDFARDAEVVCEQGRWIDGHGDYYGSVALTALLAGNCRGWRRAGGAAECRELLGCWDGGGADKVAEVCAVVLTGEAAPAAVVLAGDGVRSDDELGRNRK